MAEDSWTELLPENPIFEELRIEGDVPLKGTNVMCEIRGDLFVWSQSKAALLTTNLKRLVAYPSQPPVFQTLVCTSAPLTAVLQLLPDPDGLHIALRCMKALSVMKLHRVRGQYGEFGGGQKTVNCKVVAVAGDLFSVYRQTLELLQVQWHPHQPGTLCLLTSDDTLRVFSLANPNVPLLTFPLSAPTPLHGCALDDSVVAFSLLSTAIFILRDTGDVHLSSLSPDAPCSPPLVMHPPAEDNYGSDASRILALPTSPSTLIIANSSGTLHHCVYIHEEMQQQEEEDERSGSQMLYVVESVQLDLTSSDSEITLMPDPVDLERYYVLHSEGVHMITLPWLTALRTFVNSESGPSLAPSLVATKKACVEHLVVTEPDVLSLQGVVVISEPLLDCSLVGLTSDWECITLSLTPSPESQHPLVNTTTAVPDPSPSSQRHSLRNEFEQEIQDILYSGGVRESVPRLRRHTGEGQQEYSQQECFRFLSHSIEQLTTRFLLRQQKAKARLKQRIDVLCRQKEQQVDELVRLGDEQEGAVQYMEILKERVEQINTRTNQLVHRVEKLACQLDAQSPVLSDAEVNMAEELKGLTTHLDHLKQKLGEVRAKLELGLNHDRPFEPTLSAGQSKAVLSALTEGGQNIKALMQQIKSLSSMAPT